MEWQNIPYMILLTLSGMGTAALALYVWWRRRITPEARTLTLLMLAVAEWSLAYLMEFGSTEFAAKVFWIKVEYLGIATLPTAWLCFALQYTKRDKWLSPRNLILLSIEPVIILLLVWSNSAHHLFWNSLKLDGGGSFSALVLDRGVGAWFHVAYSYLLLLVGAFLIAETLIRASYLYRKQAGVMLIALLAPWAGNAMYITGWNPFPHLDLTPFAFTITCGAWVWGLFRFRLLDIVPIAREAIVENIGDAVIVLDAQNRLVDFNPAAERILDTTVSKAIGQPVEHVFSGWPELLKHFREEADASLGISKGEGEAQQFFDMRISPLYDRHGIIAGRLALLHDVTKRRQLEYQLHQSSKLAAIGELAAGVAHEINNPIAAIEIHAGLINDVFEELEDKVTDSYREQIHKYVRTIEQEVERCQSTTDSLLSFSRIPRSKGESFGINELLRKTTRMVSSISGSDANVELKLDRELPSYWGSPNLLQQVFVNLLSNAFKATGAKDKITISTHLKDDRHIRIQFTDSGHGIPEDIRERIFDPFFTTRPEGQGTGLGLSISYYIVKQMNGEISFDRAQGQGTTFTVILPVVDSPPEA